MECRTGGGGHESVVISAIARIHTYGSSPHSFLYAFRRGLAPVRNGRMFAGRESTVLAQYFVSISYQTKVPSKHCNCRAQNCAQLDTLNTFSLKEMKSVEISS